MKYILFFDIDGTIFDHEIIPDSTKVAIKKAQENGHLCIINTGRPYSTIPQAIKDFGFDGYVCGCGTYVELKGQEIYHHQLSYDVKKEMLELMFQYPIDMALEAKEESCFIPRVESEEFMKCFEEFNKAFNLHQYVRDEVVNFDKMTLFFKENTDIIGLKERLSTYFDIIERDVTFIECQPHHHSKASGIQIILDVLNMSIDQTISFGDSTNDLPMLTYTKQSVAMGNSKADVFKHVTYITKDIQGDGIYHALKHFNLI